MNLQELVKIGGLVSRTPVKKEISFVYPVPLPQEQWADPNAPEYPDQFVTEEASVTTWVRKRSASDFLELFGVTGKDEKALMAIWRCVCDEQGQPVFDSLEQVRQLAPWLLFPLLNAVTEVNNKTASPAVRTGRARRTKAKGRDADV